MTGLQQHGNKQHSLYKGLDMYRKVPVDFLESTKRGSFLSIFAILLTATLLYKETKSFMEETLITKMQLDMSSDNEKEKLRINFNITMMDLKCDFIQLDALSIFGEEQNVQQNVLKRGIDSDGVKKRYMSRNKQQDDIKMFDPLIDESFEDMLERKQGNQDILDVTPDTFDDVLSQNQFVFVDYYASWCSHCRALMPTWEALAEIMNTASVDKAKEALEAHKKDLEDAATHNGEMKDVWTEERLKHAEEDAFKVPVVIAKVDCVDHAELCRTHLIGAYPTLRLFVNGEKYGGDFYGDRTVLSFTDYLATVEEQYLEKKGALNDIHDTQTEKSRKMAEEKGGKQGREADFHKKKHRKGNIVDDFNLMDDDYYRVVAQDDDLVRKGRYKHSIHNEWIDKDHPGCEVSGFLIVDRVPGNFHLLARSSTHDLVPQMTNTSHQINHLSFGDPYVRQRLENGQLSIPSKLLPSDLFSKLKPMDNNVYVNYNLHEAYHHYLKLVTTNFEFSSDKTNAENRYNYYSKNRPIKVYQTKSQSQIVYYQTDVVPEAKFQYDFSPVSMTFLPQTRRWYDYMTSIMAIVGGMFTVIGMIEGTAGTVARKLSKRRR